jgi:ubiquinone/menaquinone biosynthesis C-methylase UbiE/acyl carrier protein
LENRGSYKLSEFSSSATKEIDRLRAQVDLFWPKEVSLYREFGLVDGLRVLECGSGPGYLLRHILDSFPHCQATALEIDEAFFPALQENAKAFPEGQFETINSSVMDIDLPDESYDFVVSRMVFEHLHDPNLATQEVFRVLKPGGKVVLIDNDFDLHLQTFPLISVLDELYAAYCKAREADGGDPRIGRRLPLILEDAGFVDIALSVASAHSCESGDAAFLAAESVGISSKLVKDGFLGAEMLDQIAKEWREVLRSPAHAFYRQLFVVGGTKPAHKSQKANTILEQQTAQEHETDEVSKRAKASLQDIVMQTVSQVLKTPIERLSLDDCLIDLGLDSIGAVDIIAVLKDELSIELLVSDFFDELTLRELLNRVRELEDTLVDSQQDGGSEAIEDSEEGEL